MYPQRHRSFVLPVSLFILPSFSYFVKSSYRRHYLPSLTLYHHGRSKVSLFFFPASHSPSVYLALYLRLSSSSFISQLFFSSSCSCLHSVSLLFLLSLSFPLYCFSFTCWCNASVLYASALPHSAQMWAWYLSVANTELIKPVFYLCRLAVALYHNIQLYLHVHRCTDEGEFFCRLLEIMLHFPKLSTQIYKCTVIFTNFHVKTKVSTQNHVMFLQHLNQTKHYKISIKLW